VLTEVADGVLVHESEFYSSRVSPRSTAETDDGVGSVAAACRILDPPFVQEVTPDIPVRQEQEKSP